MARGNHGEFASNRADDQEISMLCLHLLQISLVYINTLLIQRVLAEPEWAHKLEAVDRRALSPLLLAHINPYGIQRLDMHTRLPIDPPRRGSRTEAGQLYLYDEEMMG